VPPLRLMHALDRLGTWDATLVDALILVAFLALAVQASH
jgi:hypothetical protein